jgi:hypothetical protein
MVEFERFFRVTSSSKRAPAGKSADEPHVYRRYYRCRRSRHDGALHRTRNTCDGSWRISLCGGGLPQWRDCLRVDQFGEARSRRLAPRGDDRHFGSVTSPQPSEPRRLHNLHKRGALRAMLLCLARDTHGRVVFGVPASLTGGVTRWNILTDTKLSDTVPEVFAPPQLDGEAPNGAGNDDRGSLPR